MRSERRKRKREKKERERENLEVFDVLWVLGCFKVTVQSHGGTWHVCEISDLARSEDETRIGIRLSVLLN